MGENSNMSTEQRLSHSPGPWRVNPDCWVMVENAEGKNLALVHLNGNPADSRLIAAAPDLLEALKLAARELGQYVDLQQKLDYLEYAATTQKKLDVVNAAIAKAEGRL